MDKIEKILVVDDEPDNLETLERLIKKLRPVAAITKADDGLRAYQMARNETFGLIVTDFRMPRLDGAKLINALRDNPFNRKTPTVVLSGFVDEAKEECSYFKLDRVLYLEKPIQSEEFVKEVNSFIENLGEGTKSTDVSNKPTAIKLDVNFINPFLIAVKDTLTTLGGVKNLDKKTMSPINRETLIAATNICGQIGINSQYFSGRLSVLFPVKTFLNVANRILDQKYEAISETNKDVIGEIANIVHGTAKRTLNENGYAIEPTLPKIHTDVKLALENSASQGICIEFDSDAGPLFVALEIHSVA